MEPKIAVYVCHCGSNIARTPDITQRHFTSEQIMAEIEGVLA